MESVKCMSKNVKVALLETKEISKKIERAISIYIRTSFTFIFNSEYGLYQGEKGGNSRGVSEMGWKGLLLLGFHLTYQCLQIDGWREEGSDGNWRDSVNAVRAGFSQTCMPYFISDAGLTVNLEIWLHNTIALLINLVCCAFVAPTAAHYRTSSVSSCIKTALSKVGWKYDPLIYLIKGRCFKNIFS